MRNNRVGQTEIFRAAPVQPPEETHLCDMRYFVKRPLLTPPSHSLSVSLSLIPTYACTRVALNEIPGRFRVPPWKQRRIPTTRCLLTFDYSFIMDSLSAPSRTRMLFAFARRFSAFAGCLFRQFLYRSSGLPADLCIFNCHPCMHVSEHSSGKDSQTQDQDRDVRISAKWNQINFFVVFAFVKERNAKVPKSRATSEYEKNTKEGGFSGGVEHLGRIFFAKDAWAPLRNVHIYTGGERRGRGGGIGKTAKPRDVTLNLSAAYPHTRRYPSILLYPRDAVLRMTAPPADLSHKT